LQIAAEACRLISIVEYKKWRQGKETSETSDIFGFFGDLWRNGRADFWNGAAAAALADGITVA